MSEKISLDSSEDTYGLHAITWSVSNVSLSLGIYAS